MLNTQKTVGLGNYTQFKYLVILVMLYMSVTLCSAVLTYRLVSWPFLAQAGTFVKPLWFILADIIAEIYGLKISKLLVVFSFICQLLFVLVCEILIRFPIPVFWHNQGAYNIVLGPLWWVTISSFIAYMIAGFVNVNLITQWKQLTAGRYFWLRSIGSSGIAELLFSLIAVFMIQIGQPLDMVFKIVITSIILKISYSIILAGPANLLVICIKRVTNLDVYNSIDFNPFSITDNTEQKENI
jgi:uncharacterized integral membrane protein (TIGR00697 family)